MFFFSAIQNGFDGEKALYNVPKCLQICWIFDLKGGFPSLSFFSRIHTHANIELTYIQNYKILKTRLYPLNIWWRKNCNEIYTTEHSARKLRPIAFGVVFFSSLVYNIRSRTACCSIDMRTFSLYYHKKTTCERMPNASDF